MAGSAYEEGDWFAVPLRNGGFALGVVARTNPDGVLLGYFFGSKYAKVPDLGEVKQFRSSDAVMVRRFGHLGLKQGKWPILGRLTDWNRREWSMPGFVRYEELTGRSYRVFYDDNDPNKLVREEQVQPDEPEQGAKDGLLGAGAVEKVLTGIVG